MKINLTYTVKKNLIPDYYYEVLSCYGLSAKNIKNSSLFIIKNIFNSYTYNKELNTYTLKNNLHQNQLDIIHTVNQTILTLNAKLKSKYEYKLNLYNQLKEFDLMFDLDKFVFITAAKDLYELTKKGIELPISINLSSASLCNPKIVDLISAVISRIKINPKLLTIEITESAFIEEKQKSKEIVEQIKALGLNIALDDFCTGYSSMEYLLSYSADYLKIDREFIKEIHTDAQRGHIVKGLITIAQSLGMSVIAEGVEKKEEANELVKMNCNSIQGYFFGKPQKLEELVDVIN